MTQQRIGTESVWKVVGASVAGSGHVKTGRPCEDAARYQVCPMPMGAPALVAAVADGAGSCAHSARGALAAADAALAEAVSRLPAVLTGDLLPGEIQPGDLLPRDSESVDGGLIDLLRHCLWAGHRRLVEIADAEGQALRDYSTTLLLSVQVDGLLAVAQIGDGAIIAAGPDAGYFMASVPDRSGEYANETSFVTEKRSIEDAQFAVFPVAGSGSRLVMFTDGLQNLVLEYGCGPLPVPHDKFFSSLFDWFGAQRGEYEAFAGLRRFLSSSKVRARTDDDVTLLMATRG